MANADVIEVRQGLVGSMSFADLGRHLPGGFATPGSVDMPAALIIPLFLLYIWFLGCICRRSGHTFVKVRPERFAVQMPTPTFASQARQLQLALIQSLAIVFSVAVPLYQHLSTLRFCLDPHTATGLEAAIEHVQTLQLPWEARTSVPRCSAEFVIEQFLGNAGIVSSVQRFPRAMMNITDEYDVPLSCGSHGVQVLAPMSGESPLIATWRFFAIVVYNLHLMPQPTLGEAASAVQRERTRNSSAIISWPTLPGLKNKESFRFIRYHDALLQHNGGYPDATTASTSGLVCASRRGPQAVEDAIWDCQMRGVSNVLLIGLFLATTVLRINVLTDQAEIQNLVGQVGLSRSDRQRLRFLRHRIGTGWFASIPRLVVLYVPVVLAALILWVVNSRASTVTPCSAQLSQEVATFSIMFFYLPSLVSRGLVRAAALQESVGLRGEASMLLIITLCIFALAVAARHFFFSTLMGFALVRVLLAAAAATVILFIPAQYAAYDEWLRRTARQQRQVKNYLERQCYRCHTRELPGVSARTTKSDSSLLDGPERLTWQCGVFLVIGSLALLDNFISPVTLWIDLGFYVMAHALLKSADWGCLQGSYQAAYLCCCCGCCRHRSSAEWFQALGARTGLSFDGLASRAQERAISERRSRSNLRVEEGSSSSPSVRSLSLRIDVGSVGVENVLRNLATRGIFLDHLRNEFSVEPGLFVVDVWKLQSGDEVSDEDVEESVGRIWTSYIVPDSEMWINLPAIVTKRIGWLLQQMNEDGLHIPDTPGFVEPGLAALTSPTAGEEDLEAPSGMILTGASDSILAGASEASLLPRSATSSARRIPPRRRGSTSSQKDVTSQPKEPRRFSLVGTQAPSIQQELKVSELVFRDRTDVLGEGGDEKLPTLVELIESVDSGVRISESADGHTSTGTSARGSQPGAASRGDLLYRARHVFDTALRTTLRGLQIDSFARFQRTAAMKQVLRVLQNESSTDED
jgi:hypothetical protein